MMPIKHVKYLPFEQARAFVRALHLPSGPAYTAWCRSGAKPAHIPAHPSTTYGAAQWRGWQDWLGTAYSLPSYHSLRPFADARVVARGLGFSTQVEWRQWVHSPERPPDIPIAPDLFYKHTGWTNWVDFLDAGRCRRRQWRAFEDARALVRALGFPNAAQWEAWARTKECPPDIPLSPDAVYKHAGWRGWPDWLGKPAPCGDWQPFAEARAFARSLGLRTGQQWEAWAKTDNRPADIPRFPHAAYLGKGWAGMPDWLGSYTHPGAGGRFLPFEQARAFAREQSGCRSSAQWIAWSRTAARPACIPAMPSQVYENKGWAGFNDWLGVSYETALREGMQRAAVNIAAKRAARLAARQQEQETCQEHRAKKCASPFLRAAAREERRRARLSRAALGLPTDGRGRSLRAYRPFAEARAFARTLGLKNNLQWQAWARSGSRPTDIPANPRVIYAEWLGIADWLGYRGSATINALYAYAVSLKPVERHVPPATLRALFYGGEWPDTLTAHYGSQEQFLVQMRAASKIANEFSRRAAVCALLCSRQPVPDVTHNTVPFPPSEKDEAA